MTNSLAGFDFFSEEHLRNPHPGYELARDESPVYKIPGQDAIWVFGYDEVLEALMNPKVFSSKNREALLGNAIYDPKCQEIFERGWPQVDTLLTNDPPSHTRFKKLVNRAFTRERVDGMEEYLLEVIDNLIDSFIDSGECELVQDFAIPLPCNVIAAQLGVPQEDVEMVKEWSDAFIALIGSELTPDEKAEQAEMVVKFQHYMMARLDERRSDPKEDMLTDLLNARVDNERPLDDKELLSVSQQILVAGNTTTTHMITGGVLTLIENPDQLEKIREKPDLIPNMVEELLRMQTPTQAMWRRATEDTELGGVEIPKDSLLMLAFTSANRDQKHFDNPHSFNVERDFTSAHVAFSRGVHTCIGMMLSRKELVCAFRRIVERLENMRLDTSKPVPQYIPSLIFRGLETLYMKFDKRGKN